MLQKSGRQLVAPGHGTDNTYISYLHLHTYAAS